MEQGRCGGSYPTSPTGVGNVGQLASSGVARYRPYQQPNATELVTNVPCDATVSNAQSLPTRKIVNGLLS
eukprot:668314-Rhodomonas_salina.2